MAPRRHRSGGHPRTHNALAEAELILHVIDLTDPTPPETAVQSLLEGRPTLTVYSKCDLISDNKQVSHLTVSALTGKGIEQLREAIVHAVTGEAASAETATLTNLRQHQAIATALTAIRGASDSATRHTPHEFLLLDLYAALAALDGLTGTTTPDDILNLIFSSFCIGK